MDIFLYYIRKYHVALLSIIFLAYSFIQLINNNIYQKAEFNSAANPVYTTINQVDNNLYTYLNLGVENQKLMDENLELRQKLEYHLSSQKLDTIQFYSKLSQLRYTLKPARVIMNKTSLKNNFFVFDLGKKDGIKKGDAVISAEGIAGYVYKCNPNFSVAISVLNKNFKAVPLIVETKLNNGYINWGGGDYTTVDLLNINKFEDIKVGYNLVTSSTSYNFPQGVNIGTISKVSKPNKGSYYNIKVTLSTNFSQLKNVYIIADKYKHQVDTLSHTVPQ